MAIQHRTREQYLKCYVGMLQSRKPLLTEYGIWFNAYRYEDFLNNVVEETVSRIPDGSVPIVLDYCADFEARTICHGFLSVSPTTVISQGLPAQTRVPKKTLSGRKKPVRNTVLKVGFQAVTNIDGHFLGARRNSEPADDLPVWSPSVLKVKPDTQGSASTSTSSSTPAKKKKKKKKSTTQNPGGMATVPKTPRVRKTQWTLMTEESVAPPTKNYDVRAYWDLIFDSLVDWGNSQPVPVDIPFDREGITGLNVTTTNLRMYAKLYEIWKVILRRKSTDLIGRLISKGHAKSLTNGEEFASTVDNAFAPSPKFVKFVCLLNTHYTKLPPSGKNKVE